MALLRFIAAFVLWFELPVPFYWFVLHPNSAYWRLRQRHAFAIAVTVWPAAFVLLAIFYKRLFARVAPPAWQIVLGLLLVALEFWLFVRVKRELGAARLIGKTELEGGGEMQTAGLYGYVRHPRYAGMFAAVLGAALIAGTRVLWIVIAVWAPFALAAIRMEEREMRRRFGAAYIEYSRRVPRFLPLKFRT